MFSLSLSLYRISVRKENICSQLLMVLYQGFFFFFLFQGFVSFPFFFWCVFCLVRVITWSKVFLLKQQDKGHLLCNSFVPLRAKAAEMIVLLKSKAKQMLIKSKGLRQGGK